VNNATNGLDVIERIQRVTTFDFDEADCDCDCRACVNGNCSGNDERNADVERVNIAIVLEW